ncbi:MAG TPA: cobamide remodeling phosphodiesterase CbiR [Anaerolineaceae bacterium]|nr:cobamide remodeling phosphodiesterase CbiR [Anaerolineaceae bacterium]
MKFGIMAMQIGMLAPADRLSVDPIAHVAAFDHAALALHLHRAGFNPIELSGDLSLFFPQAFSPASVEGLARLQRETAIRYTLHLPLWSVEPSTLQPPVRAGSVQAIIENIQHTLPLAPEMYVLHATGALAAEFYRMRLPDAAHAMILKQFQANAGQSIEKILQETGIPSRKLAIETIEFPFDLTLELAERYDTSICLDTGHILSGFSGNVELHEALERVQPRLGEVHLHDSPRQRYPLIEYGKDHQPLGAGDLDTEALLNWLLEHGIENRIVFELTLEQATASVNHIRALRPNWVDDTEDIKRLR